MMYAPVRRLSEVTVKNGRLAGRAHPEAGEPCAIELVSGPHVIGAVRAERAADRDGNAGSRPGGYSFGIDLRPADFIFSDELVLRCAVSKEVLHVVHFGAVEWPAPPEITEVSVADILERYREEADQTKAAGTGLPAEQRIEKWGQLMFPDLAPDDFRAFISALEPGSPERAALLALADLRALSTAPRAPSKALPEALKPVPRQAVARPTLEDGNDRDA